MVIRGVVVALALGYLVSSSERSRSRGPASDNDAESPAVPTRVRVIQVARRLPCHAIGP